MNRRRIAAAGLSLAAIGAGLAVNGPAHAPAPTVATAAPASPACIAHVQLFEDGSWAGGTVERVSADRQEVVADAWQIAPGPERIAPNQYGRMTFFSQWPVTLDGVRCAVTLD